MKYSKQTNNEDVRIIITSTENGDSEHVTFTQDFDTNADNWAYPRETVDSDSIINMDVPNGFPMDYTLKRN